MIFASPHIRKNQKSLPSSEINRLALLAKDGDENAIEAVLRALSPLILAFLSKRSMPAGWASDGDDIYQSCMEKCLSGIKTFNPEKGATFTTHIYYWINFGYSEGFYSGTPNITFPRYCRSDFINDDWFFDTFGTSDPNLSEPLFDEDCCDFITDACYSKCAEFRDACNSLAVDAVMEGAEAKRTILSQFSELKPLQKQVAMLEAGVIDYCKSGLEYMEVFHGMAGRGNTTWHKSQARKEFERKGMREWLV